MSKSKYRDTITDSTIDDIESDVNKALDTLKDLDYEDSESVKDNVESAIDVLQNLADDLY